MTENQIHDRYLKLYHLIWGSYTLDINKPMIPRVPFHTIQGEDSTIRRICTSPSLDERLSGLGPTFIGLSFLSEMRTPEGYKIDLENVTLPFVMVQFCVDRTNPDVLMPGKVSKYVPDAFMTQECWLTKPTVPEKTEQLWLVNGKIREEAFLYEGKKWSYYIVSDSEWSSVEKKPDTEFLKSIVKVTKMWLEQSLDMEKENTSLDSKIGAAVGRKTDCDKGVLKSKESEGRKGVARL